jgi:CO2 hydration protein
MPTSLPPTRDALQLIDRLQSGQPLLPHSPQNLVEVVGILKSYGMVLDAYQRNLLFIAQEQFLEFFTPFKYFDGKISLPKILRHLWHDRINYEFAEYCMRAMFWHGGGTLDKFVDTPHFQHLAEAAIHSKYGKNPLIMGLHRLFPEFLREQVRQMAYYHALGVFWSVMAEIFLTLSDRYDHQEINSISEVVDHIREGIVKAIPKSVAYRVSINHQSHEIIPELPQLNFLEAAAIPYVETVFFRSFPFRGTVSYNAQLPDIPPEISQFNYGALYADPLPVGGAGIPPTLLMQDMYRFLPDYLVDFYRQFGRGTDDLRIKICISFQKSMFCVTTAVIQGLAPFPLTTTNPTERKAVYKYLRSWCDRLAKSRLMGFLG